MLFEREFGGSVDFTNGRADVSIDITALPAGFNLIEDRITIGMDVVNTGTGTLLWTSEITGINVTGPHTFPPATGAENTAAATLAEGDSLSVYIYVAADNFRGFTYNIDYVRISTTSEAYTPTGGPASFILSLDVVGTVFTDAFDDNFSAGDTATEALQYISNLVRDQYNQIVVDAVTDYTITNAIADLDATLTSRRTSGAVGSNGWDLRDGDQISSSPATIIGWGSFVNNWFHFNTGENYFPEGSTGTITITDGNDATNSVVLEWNDVTQLSNFAGDQGTALRIRALDSELGTPPTSGSVSYTHLTLPTILLV